MIIIRNNIIPFKGFRAINICGLLFVRGKAQINDRVINHERIHTAQILELAFVIFYLWYLVEWIFLLCKYRNSRTAYRSIRFEKEAYLNDNNQEYLDSRKHYNWIKL